MVLDAVVGVDIIADALFVEASSCDHYIMPLFHSLKTYFLLVIEHVFILVTNESFDISKFIRFPTTISRLVFDFLY